MLISVAHCCPSVVFVNLAADETYVGADGRLTYTVADTGTTGGPAGPTDMFDVWIELKSMRASSVVDFAGKIAAALPGKFQSVFEERSRRTGKPFQQFIPGDIAVLGFEGDRPAFVRIIFATVGGKITANIKNDGVAFVRQLSLNPGTREMQTLGARPVPVRPRARLLEQ
jgi:hypothetical protein